MPSSFFLIRFNPCDLGVLLQERMGWQWTMDSGSGPRGELRLSALPWLLATLRCSRLGPCPCHGFACLNLMRYTPLS